MKAALAVMLGILLTTSSLLLSSAGIAVAATTDQGATLSLGAVFSHPIQSLSDFNNPFNFLVDGQDGGFPALFELYPYTYYAANDTAVGTYVTSTQVFPQNNTYILHLRNDTGWSNGQPVTAWDLYANIFWSVGLGSPAYNAKVIDNYTLSVSVPVNSKTGLNGINIGSILFGPDAGDNSMVVDYAHWATTINHIVGNLTALQNGNATVLGALTKEVIGHQSPMMWSGPYYPVSVSSSAILMQKNPYFYDTKKLTISTVKINQFTSASALYQALISGQLSYYFGGNTITDVSGSALPAAFQAAIPSYIQQIPTQGYTGPGIFFNNASSSVSNTLVRQAVAYALNRTEVAAAGGASYSALTYPTGLAEYMYPTVCDASCQGQMPQYSTNMTAATNLMQQAGYNLTNGAWTAKNGTAITLNLVNSKAADATWLSMALDIQTQLHAFGIGVNLINPVNPGTYALSGKGFDMYLANWGWFVTPWDVFRPIYIYNGFYYPVLHFQGNITIPINSAGKTNVITLFEQLQSVKNTTTEYKLDEDLAWVVSHYLPYLTIAETNPIMYLNTQQFTWPSASSPVWGAIISQDPGLAILTAEQGGLISVGSTTSTATTTSASTIVITSTVTSTATSTATSTGISTAVSTSTATQTSTAVSTATVTGTPPSSGDILYPAIAGVAIVVIVILIGLLAMTRRRRRAPP